MPNRLTTLIVIRRNRTLTESRWYAWVLYALRGEIGLAIDSGNLKLSNDTGAVLVTNPGKHVVVDPSPGALCVAVRIDMRLVRNLLNDREITFFCDPTLRHQASYDDLRRLLEELLKANSAGGDFAELHRQGAETAFVQCLLDGFGGAVSQEVTRAEAYCRFIDTHYQEPLSLADMAKRFHLSTEHFAKVFKAEVGKTFHAQLTDVRLDAAADLLAASDETVTHVALEAGFPNTASLNQAFKARYGMTPTRYRKERHLKEDASIPASVIESLDYDGAEEARSPANELLVQADARHTSHTSQSFWRDSIGLGQVGLLSDARVRDQVLWLHRHLGFTHCRIAVDFGQRASGKGLYELESNLEFLMNAQIVPHFLVEHERDADCQAYAQALGATLRLFANRYSVGRVCAWRFELRVRSWEHEGSFDTYLSFYEQVSKELAALGVEEQLLGPSLFLDQGAQNLRSFVRSAYERGLRLDAVTIACRPVAPAVNEEGVQFIRTADRLYLRNQVLMAREVLVTEGWGSARILVSSWRDSLEMRNIMNDSCFEGASIVQTAFSVYDVVDQLCYSDALDLAEEDNWDGGFLSGNPGLLNRDGIPKPSYYAFEFLARLNERLLLASDQAFVSGNDMGNYQVVCHNCERLNAAYLVTPEEQLDYHLLDSYFVERRERMVRVRISGAKPGTYLVKKRFVNAQGGSLGDEAERMRLWCMDAPSRGELERLRAAAQPQLVLERLVVTDGVLEFSHLMQSNEIAYFHIIYLY